MRQRAVDLPPEQRQIHIETAAEEALPHLLRQALAEGGCAGMIVNTVKKAQALAALLRAALPECHVVLFHAQFLMPDRAEKERFLLERLGKGSTAAQRTGSLWWARRCWSSRWISTLTFWQRSCAPWTCCSSASAASTGTRPRASRSAETGALRGADAGGGL